MQPLPNILISDHSPTSVVLDLRHLKQGYNWRFNPNLLTEKSFCQFIDEKIVEFIETNDKHDVSDSVLWETFKVVVRGHIISFESSLKKKQRQRMLDIEAKLTELEQAHKASSCSSILQDILKLKYEYNSILSTKVSDQLIRIKQKHFELGDKPHNLLSRQLRGMQANRAIHRIKSKSGEILIDPKAINGRFKEYYENLYKSRSKGDISAWLGMLDPPKLNDAAQNALNADVTIQEIVLAIKSFPNGKAAGQDGFGVELYKKKMRKKLLPCY